MSSNDLMHFIVPSIISLLKAKDVEKQGGKDSIDFLWREDGMGLVLF